MKKVIKWKDIKRGTKMPLKVIARWKSCGINVENGNMLSLDCFQFSDQTYYYDYATVTNEEAEERCKDKERYTIDELNATWYNTPMARCARRELKPNWEFEKNLKCSCGTDKAGGGLHQDYCDKAKYD